MHFYQLKDIISIGYTFKMRVKKKIESSTRCIIQFFSKNFQIYRSYFELLNRGLFFRKINLNYPLFLSFQVEWEEEASQNGDENESAPDDDVCNFFTWKRQVPIFWFRSAVRSWTEKTPYYFQDSIILRLAYSRVVTLTGGLCEDHLVFICHFLSSRLLNAPFWVLFGKLNPQKFVKKQLRAFDNKFSSR